MGSTAWYWPLVRVRFGVNTTQLVVAGFGLAASFQVMPVSGQARMRLVPERPSERPNRVASAATRVP